MAITKFTINGVLFVTITNKEFVTKVYMVKNGRADVFLPPTADVLSLFPCPHADAVVILPVLRTKYFLVYTTKTDELIPIKHRKCSFYAPMNNPCYKGKCAVPCAHNDVHKVHIFDIKTMQIVMTTKPVSERIVFARPLRGGALFATRTAATVQRRLGGSPELGLGGYRPYYASTEKTIYTIEDYSRIDFTQDGCAIIYVNKYVPLITCGSAPVPITLPNAHQLSRG